MSKTVAQIYAINPTTVVADTDLYYLVQSPYTPGTDAAITGADLKIAFGAGGTINPGLGNQLAYYASGGSAISGLATAANGTLITSPAGVPSISSTLPNAVQDNITRLGTIASIGAPLGGTFGGTGVNNGANTATFSGNLNFAAAFTTSGAFSVTQTYTGITNVTFPTSGTLATTSQLLVSPLTTKGDLWGWSTTNDRLPVGSINGQVLQVSSGASLGLAYSTATYPSTATNTARILRADGTNWVQSTSTFADTYAASSVLYANGANNIAGLTTANNGLLVTGATGIPSILAGPGVTGRILQSNAAAAPSFSTATFPSVGGAAGNVIISDGTNYISSTSLWPNTVGTSGKVVISNGTSNVYSTPTFPNASATLNKIIKSDGTNWIASTETYAVPGTSGNVMTSDGTNWTSAAPAGVTLLTTKGDLFGFSTVNARVPVASGNGKVLQVDSSASVGLSYSTATYPTVATGTGTLLRADGTNWVATTSTYPNTNAINTLLYASAANVMSALATANSGVLVTDSSGVPSISSTLPAFTTSSITFNPTTGGIVGTTTNDSAAAGKVGEVGTANASGVSLTTLTAKTVTSVSLTAGDWDVTGSIAFTIGGLCSAIASGISTTNNALPAAPLSQFIGSTGSTLGTGSCISAPMQRISLSGTTTVYLVAQSNFSTSTVSANGTIFARRVR